MNKNYIYEGTVFFFSITNKFVNERNAPCGKNVFCHILFLVAVGFHIHSCLLENCGESGHPHFLNIAIFYEILFSWQFNFF